jgi:hypothetical protein
LTLSVSRSIGLFDPRGRPYRRFGFRRGAAFLFVFIVVPSFPDIGGTTLATRLMQDKTRPDAPVPLRRERCATSCDALEIESVGYAFTQRIGAASDARADGNEGCRNAAFTTAYKRGVYARCS